MSGGSSEALDSGALLRCRLIQYWLCILHLGRSHRCWHLGCPAPNVRIFRSEKGHLIYSPHVIVVLKFSHQKAELYPPKVRCCLVPHVRQGSSTNSWPRMSWISSGQCLSSSVPTEPTSYFFSGWNQNDRLFHVDSKKPGNLKKNGLFLMLHVSKDFGEHNCCFIPCVGRSCLTFKCC